MELANKKVGIIGSGIIGLNVAIALQERFPGLFVRIHAHRIFDSTVSWGAAGVFRLSETEYSTNIANIKKWYNEGAKHFFNIWRSDEAVNAGVQVMGLYQVSNENFRSKEPVLDDVYVGYRQVSSHELSALGFNPKMKSGTFCQVPVVEPRYHLPYLTNKFTKNGGEIKIEMLQPGKQAVADWAVNNKYDVIVNCSGLEAGKLFGDSEIYPERGQLVRVSAPWMKFGFITNDDVYAYSVRSSCVLGGFRQANDWDLQIRPSESDKIVERVAEYMPCFATAVRLEEWTGLRPSRSTVRVETEVIQAGNGVQIPVVHNYGHGGRGITLAYGTAQETVKLVAAALNSLTY